MAKQAHGSGSIRRRKDGRWEGRCNMGIDRKTGKPIVKSIYGKSQREVAEQLRKLAVQRDEHTYEETSKMKFSAWLDIYVNDCMVSLKPYTQKTYERVIRNHIKPELGNYRLEELTSLLIQRFINGLRNSKDGNLWRPKR